jgi:hypothetical protein
VTRKLTKLRILVFVSGWLWSGNFAAQAVTSNADVKQLSIVPRWLVLTSGQRAYLNRADRYSYSVCSTVSSFRRTYEMAKPKDCKRAHAGEIVTVLWWVNDYSYRSWPPPDTSIPIVQVRGKGWSGFTSAQFLVPLVPRETKVKVLGDDPNGFHAAHRPTVIGVGMVLKQKPPTFFADSEIQVKVCSGRDRGRTRWLGTGDVLLDARGEYALMLQTSRRAKPAP